MSLIRFWMSTSLGIPSTCSSTNAWSCRKSPCQSISSLQNNETLVKIYTFLSYFKNILQSPYLYSFRDHEVKCSSSALFKEDYLPFCFELGSVLPCPLKNGNYKNIYSITTILASKPMMNKCCFVFIILCCSFVFCH